MKTYSLIVLLAFALFGCSGSPFTAVDSLTISDAGMSETADIAVTVTVAEDVGPETGARESEPETVDGSGSSSGEASTGSSSGGSGADSGPSSDSSPASDSGACVPGVTQCASDTQVETCGTNGQWGDATTCQYACVSGNCGGSCVPGATQCASYTQIEMCGVDGQWGVATTCPQTAEGLCCIAGGCSYPNGQGVCFK